MDGRPPRARRLALCCVPHCLAAAAVLAGMPFLALGQPIAPLRRPSAPSRDGAALLKWSMEQHAKLGTYRASCSWTMSFGAGSAETHAERLVVYARPNRFRVVSDLGQGRVMASTCDGARLVEYSHGHPRPVTYPAPRSIADVPTLQMGHPMFCGSLLYRFFGGPARYNALVDGRRGRPALGPDAIVDGMLCHTVRFYARGTYGRTEVAIGASDGLVRRISYGSEPLLAMMKRDLRGGAPTISRTTETYDAIARNVRLAGDAFRIPAAPVRVASAGLASRSAARAVPRAAAAASRPIVATRPATAISPVSTGQPVPIPPRHTPRSAPRAPAALAAAPATTRPPSMTAAAPAAAVPHGQPKPKPTLPVARTTRPEPKTAISVVKAAPVRPSSAPRLQVDSVRPAVIRRPASAAPNPAQAKPAATPEVMAIPQPIGPPSWSAFENRPSRLPLGQPAPDFTIRDPAGRAISLQSLRGKVVVVIFWATWEPRCSEWLQKMEQIDKEVAGKGVIVMAVSNQPRPKAEAFAAASGFTLPIYEDPGKLAGARLRVPAVPTTVVIDRRGRVQAYLVGMPSVFRLWREMQGAGLDQASSSP